MSILPIIRTNNQRAQTLNLISKIKEVSTTPPVVVGDDRAGSLSYEDATFIPLNETCLASWGFASPPAKWGWFCGDFCYYAAFEACPDHSHYMLIEDDVFLSEAALRSLFQHIKKQPELDASAAYLSADYTDPPKYSARLQQYGLSANVGCIFPLTISSPAHIQAMKTLRRALLERKIDVNDEAVFASAATSGKFRHLPLEDLLPGQINKDCFSTNPPKLLEALENQIDDIQIWHPAVGYDDILHRIASGEKNYTRHRLRKVLKAAPGTMKKTIKSALAEKELASSSN